MSTSNSRKTTPKIPSECLDVLVSVNPKAGARSGSHHIERLVECLKDRGLRAENVSDIAELQRQAQARMAAGTLRAVVAGGGDGTVSLVANRTPVGTPIAILPLGTENLLAKYLDLRLDPDGLAAVLQEGRLVRLDAGEANGRIFLLMVGCGFDAEVVRRMHQQRTGHINYLSYFKPILDSVRNYQYPELRITPLDPDSGDQAGDQLLAKWVFVVNLPRYAAGLSLVPDADGTDGRLDVCTFREGSFLSGLMYLGAVIAGQHRDWEDCVTVQVRRLRIESDEPVPFQLDGDPGGYLPVDLRVLPQRLTLVVPESFH